MPFRAKIKRLVGRLNQGSGSNSTPSQSQIGNHAPSSLPDLQTPSSAILSPGVYTHLAHSESNIAVSAPATEPTTQWDILEELTSALSPMTEAFGPLRSILDELKDCVHIYEMAAKDQDEYETLSSDLKIVLSELEAHFEAPDSPKMTNSVINLCQAINLELESIKNLLSESKTRRYLRAGTGTDEVLACYRRIHGHLIRISLNTSLSVQESLESRMKDLEEDVDQTKELAKDSLVRTHLSCLSPAFSAYYNSAQAIELNRGECTPGTRIGVLAHMNDWASMSGPNAGSVYWLNGMAGTGKTTIVYSLCTELDSKHQLAASFFCSRLLPECRDVNRIIPSISYQLAQYSFPFRATLLKVLEKDPDVHTRLPSVQFKSMIVEPLQGVRDTLPLNLVVVIDALDECENKESTRAIINVLINYAPDLPIKFFVCSRPESEIRDRMMEKMSDSEHSQLVLHELDTSAVQNDINRYLRVALAQLNPSSAEIAKLVEDAELLFLYAATAVRYINDKSSSSNPYDRLQTVLNASGPGIKKKNKAIDDLYTTILRAAFEDRGVDETKREDMLLLLHTVVSLQEPLTVSALSSLLKLGSDDRVRAAVHPLWSVLFVTSTSQYVTTLHASFPEYMHDKERSGVYHCDKYMHHGALARLCLDCIDNVTPTFNICDLESSFVLDSEVVDLDERVRRATSRELVYACRYWSAHTTAASNNTELVELLRQFFSTRLLLWLEVMNLTGHIKSAADAIRLAEDWMTNQTDNEELNELAHDAWCFTATFASNAVCESTPHIYVSMLPFWPSHCPISQSYKPRLRGLPVAEGTAVNRRQLRLFTTWTFPDVASRATFSPNGERVGLAVGDAIIVVDAHNGRPLLEPLEGHTKLVLSLGFSPDGTRIVSGSMDRTLRIWDAETGKQILEPLILRSRYVHSLQYSHDGIHVLSATNDHATIWDALNGTAILELKRPNGMNYFASVRYSPDGSRIVSGSLSGMVCFWDARTGDLVLGPFSAQTSFIRLIEYSPDGQHVVTGSHDGTLQVRSAIDGTMVLGPLVGHTEHITSTAYSPDGKRIVSGSDDGSIYIWDAQSGEILLGPIERHTDSVRSLAYSPNGTRVLSCSYEQKVYVWNARSKQNGPTQAEGCAKTVEALVCSPDGASIITASDKVLHVWDAQTGSLMLGPLSGHTMSITSLCYSPMNDRFASGSHDHTVCVWDAQTGAMALEPLRGHTESVASVGYSPNGTSLTSSSGDCTIRVWDAQTGNMILLLEGHTHCVMSVKYSPTGACIASCSADETIRLWDVLSGTPIFQPLRGNTHGVASIDFSPDGTRFISVGFDSIRVWDTQTGAVIQELMESSSDHRIVQYSPQGSSICESRESVIYVRASEGGEVLLGPLDGHTHDIRSITFTPNGTSIVSGSRDKAVRIWDIQDNVRIVTVPYKPINDAPYTRCSHVVQPMLSSSTPPVYTDWKLRQDGWVVDTRQPAQLLVWVPHDLHASLMQPRNSLLISRQGYIKLNFEGAYMGTSWAECCAGDGAR